MRSDGRGGPDGNEGFYFFGAQAKLATEDGGDARADLHGGAFTAEGNTAGQGGGSAEEFSEDGA